MAPNESLVSSELRLFSESRAMIQFTLGTTADPCVLELQAGAIGGDTSTKPPLMVRRNELTVTLLMFLRAAQMGAAHV
jgi:hypothetical protein